MLVGEYIFFQTFYGVEEMLAKELLVQIKQDEKYLIAVCGCKVPREAFLRLYRLYPKIETLPEGEKRELKEYVLNRFKGQSTEVMVENAKIVYTIGKMI